MKFILFQLSLVLYNVGTFISTGHIFALIAAVIIVLITIATGRTLFNFEGDNKI
jgi:hypothetical protein